MLHVPIHYAAPGMDLAAPLYHPKRPGTVLLNQGVRLEARSIERLREIGVRDLWVRYPSLDCLRVQCNPEVIAEHGSVSRRVADMFEALHADAHAPLEFASYKSAITRLLNLLIGNARTASYISEVLSADSALVRHAANVCFLALLMGVKLDEYLIMQRSRLPAQKAKDIGALGLGAMLADIGILHLPIEVRQRWEKTRDEADPEWRRHVVIGFERVRGSVNAAAAAVVLHHHQRLDGSGFPMRQALSGDVEPVEGDDIHVFARIAAVADEFVRARFGVTADDPPATRVRALRHMLALSTRTQFDHAVMRALFAVAPPFPPGSIVVLSDERTAAVVAWSPADPCRPLVQVVDFTKPPDWDSKPERIDLAADTSVAIVQAEGQSVQRDMITREELERHGLLMPIRSAG